MKSKNALTLKLIGIIFIIGIISCNSDEEPITCSNFPYNSLEHVYGTSFKIGEGEWETVIDLNSGQYDTIPGTKRIAGSISSIGTIHLISFENNQRIFIGNQNNKLLVQDLSTSDYITIDLNSQTTNEYIFNPQYFTFGNTENQLFILDADYSLWEVDIQNNIVEKIIEDMIPSNDFYISFILYLKSSDDFIIGTTTSSFNDPVASELMLYDNEVDSIVSTKIIDRSFGFTQFPQEDNIFFLQAANMQTGFRLMELKIVGGEIQVTQKSSSDLAIDNLSGYLQAIHTETNSYICKGGSNSNEQPTTILYKIDLTTGELVSEAELEDAGIMLSLSAE